MNRYTKKRKVLRTQVTRLMNECNERLNQQLTPEDANVLHDRLTGLKVELNDVNNEIEPLVPDQDSETEFTQVFEYNDRITACLSRLAHRGRTGFPNQQSPPITDRNDNPTGATTRIRVRLPKLELMKFNGSVSQWQEFWEQLNQVVHYNNELTEVDKFNYLKTAVTGDAAAAIAGLPSTARCYEDAVTMLKSRFGNQDLLVQTHLKRLIDVKPVRSALDIRGLRCLYDTVISNIRGLETLGRQQETFSSMLFPIVQRALPKELLLDFNRKLVMEQPEDLIVPRNTLTATTTQPRESSHPSDQERTSPQRRTEDSFSKLVHLLRLEVLSRENLAALQAMDTYGEPRKKEADHKKNEDNEKARKSQTSAALLNPSSRGDRCFICKSTRHTADNCDAGTSLREKKDLLRKERRCFRCTKKNHQAKECRSNIRCQKCGGRHATSMCDPNYSPGKRTNNDTVTTSVPVNLEATTNNQEKPIVFMQTATIWCTGDKEKFRLLALFDGGSQRTSITEKASRKLGCKLLGHERLTVGVFGGSVTEKEFQRVLVFLTTQTGKIHQLEVLETELICNQQIPVPSKHLNDQLKELNCSIGDLSNDEGPTTIDLLIGSEHFWELTTGRSRKLEGRLRAVESVFGWSVQGPVEGATEELPCYQITALNAEVTESTTDILKKFWTLETIGVNDFEKNDMGNDPVMNNFEETVTQVNERYKVALPWKNMVDLGDNKGVAIKRLHQLIGVLKVLGLTWDPDSDRLTFTTSFRLEQQEKETKRSVVRTTARLYDPLGWISPFTVRAKSLFQQLWKRKVDWDDSIPDDMKEECFQWCAELDELNKIQVPRFYGFLSKDRSENVALHIFADASTVAYGAVAYVCSADVEVTPPAGNRLSRTASQKYRVIPTEYVGDIVLGRRIQQT
ncbi:uncharacterized protein LOC120841109 [Ixodes scapularis]|uniref:uncharacterized protein LOC120841109 n=1 Tax=Ixodes scapularis TaxID=6945 RepID=UPI001A9DED64|nr:uncharacterized protein LOC120841109 [Ixodes scapularis]